jgi:hypothetical protein
LFDYAYKNIITKLQISWVVHNGFRGFRARGLSKLPE